MQVASFAYPRPARCGAFFASNASAGPTVHDLVPSPLLSFTLSPLFPAPSSHPHLPPSAFFPPTPLFPLALPENGEEDVEERDMRDPMAAFRPRARKCEAKSVRAPTLLP